MKRVLWVVAAIVAFITSCAKNSESTDFLVAPSEDFTAILGSDTRTTLDGTSVKWCEDDLLTIFTKTSHNRKYEISELSDDRSSATFSYVSYTGADNTPVTANYALYPYDAEATISGNVITTTIATEQSYVKNSTNLSYALMVAKSDNTTFTFSNAGALIRFNISKIVPDSFTLQSITLTSTANKLSGEVTIDTSADCKAVVSSTGSNSVTLANIDTAIPDAGLSFYLSLPATNFDTDDLTATITFKEGVKEFVLPAFELAQGKIKTVSYSIADADDFTGNIPGDDGGDDTPVIEPKPANNEIWYTTTDGKKIFPEVVVDPIKFGAILISNTYTDGLGIMTFDDDITSIADKAFYNCDSLTSVTIPNSVTTIGKSALESCGCLTSVTIPDSVTTIGGAAFIECSSLTSVTIPNSVTTIQSSAFAECVSLTSVIIPDSVTTIGGGAFRDCSSLESVTIGDSVTTIGNDAFRSCSSLKEFKGKFAADNGRCLIKDNTIIAYAEASGTTYTIPDSVKTIGERAFYSCDSLTSVTIGNSVTTIGDEAFYSCDSLTSVTIGNSVTTIGEQAFHNCKSLTSVTIGNSVTTIGEQAFAYCFSLISVTIPDSVTTIGEEAFRGCSSLTSVTIGKGVTSFGLGVFAGCTGELIINSNIPSVSSSEYSPFYNSKFTKVTIGDSVTTIGESAFKQCSSLTSVTIGDSVTTIGDSAFHFCYSLTSVTIPDSVTTIGNYAFSNCKSLTSVTIPDGVTTIGKSAFYNCDSLTSVTIGDSVTTIGDYAFEDCDSLTSVTIPDSVTTIGKSAFSSCNSLATVYCKPTTPPTGGSSMFASNASGRRIYVPASDDDSIINAYKAANYWSNYADYIFEEE